MQPPTASIVDKKPSRAGWIVAVAALSLLVLGSAVRAVSPHLALGTRITQAECQGPAGQGDYCLRHVERADWLVLTPVDDYQLYVKRQSRHHSIGNPWVNVAHLSG